MALHDTKTLGMSIVRPDKTSLMDMHWYHQQKSELFTQISVCIGAVGLINDQCYKPVVKFCLVWIVCHTCWHHQMKTLSALLALCEENPLFTNGFPSQMPVTQSFDISLICAWTNPWANNPDASDFRCHCTHYDVTVMIKSYIKDYDIPQE